VRTDAAGEALDLGDLVQAAASGAPLPGAAAAPAAAAATPGGQQRRRRGGGGGGGGGGGAADELLGSLSDFVSGGGGGGAAAAAPDALTRLQLASGGREHDLRRVLPRLGAAAQRVHMRLLALMGRCSYCPDTLRAHLLAQVDAAEAAWASGAAGTLLGDALLAAARELEAARGVTSSSGDAEGGGEAAAAEEGADDADAAAAAEGEEASSSGGGGGGGALPRCLDFAWQRQQVEALVAALAPLMDRVGTESVREGARLAARLQREVRGGAVPDRAL
jgi:hypothetical protein